MKQKEDHFFGGRDRKQKGTTILKFFLAVAIFMGSIGLTGTLYAVCPSAPPAQQVNLSGWEQPNANLYAWSMTTMSVESVKYLFAGTNNWEGGQIWRTEVPLQADGTYNWVKILDTSADPQGNTGFRNMVVFKDRVYAGSRNESGGCQLWRSDINGENFQMVVGPDISAVLKAGFGESEAKPENESVRGMQVFGDYLYIGLQNTGGGAGELWRTMDGETYEQVVLNLDMGSSNNDSMHTMAVRDSKLYIATRNLNGGTQIWSSPDGLVFQAVVGPGGSAAAAGFGDSSNTTILDLHVHNGYLFAGVSKPGGFEVFRIDPDDFNWDQIASEGLGDRFAWYAWRFESFDNHLWLGTYNYLPLFFSWSRKGAALYKSADNGDTWSLMVGGNRRNPGECFRFGFGDRQNFGIRSFAVVDDKMYIGTGVCPNGCSSYQGAEIWVWPCVDCP